MRFRVMIIIGALLAAGSIAHAAAVVRTIEGVTHEGDVELADGALLVRPRAGGEPARVQADEILSADLRPPPAASTTTPRWIARDFGNVPLPGHSRLTQEGAVLTLRASGQGFVGNADAGHFFHQLVAGDAQLATRVTAVTQSHPLARAGAMFRASLDPAAPFVAVFVMPSGSCIFQWRSRLGGQTSFADGGVRQLPVWLRLTRNGNTFTAYASADAVEWTQIGSREVTLPTTALAGVAASAHSPNTSTSAVFNRPMFTRPLAADADRNLPSSRGIILRDGSILTGIVRFSGAPTLRLSRPRDPNLSVSVAHVGRIFLTPLNAELSARLPAGRKGVLLTSGDFVEGEVLDVDPNRVKLSSVLFGIRRVETAQVIAVAMQEVTPSASRFHLRATDGSALSCDRVTVGKDGITAELAGVGPVTFPIADVIHLRAGAARVQPLSDPSVGDAADPDHAAGRNPPTDPPPAGAPLTLGDVRVERGLVLHPGTPTAYTLGRKFKSLALRWGVAADVAPTGASLVINADGREIYRSPTRTSADEPLSLAVDLTDVEQLQIIAESSAETANRPPRVIIAEPYLIK